MHTSDARQRANGVNMHAIRPALTMVGVNFVSSKKHRKIQWQARLEKQQFNYDSDGQEFNILKTTRDE